MSDNTTITDPKERLELLVRYQREMEAYLKHRTGLTVDVDLDVHSHRNEAKDLIAMYEVHDSVEGFRHKRVTDGGLTHWLSNDSLDVTVFLPESFKPEEYPEPEDLEGYGLAVEVTNARGAEQLAAHVDTQEDEIPF